MVSLITALSRTNNNSRSSPVFNCCKVLVKRNKLLLIVMNYNRNSTSQYRSLSLLVRVTSSMSIRILYVTCGGSSDEEVLGSRKTTPAQNCLSSSSSSALSISWPSVSSPSSLFWEKHCRRRRKTCRRYKQTITRKVELGFKQTSLFYFINI